MAQLIVLDGPNRGKTYDLVDGTSRIGKAPGNTIVLADRRAGDTQAEIRQNRKHYEITNLDPKRNLVINGEVYKHAKLQHGDWITIADTTLVFSEDEPTMQPKPIEMQSIAAEDFMNTSIQSRRKFLDTAESVFETIEPRSEADRRLATLLRIGMEISDILVLKKLLNKILELVFEHFPADRGIIMLKDPDTEKLKAEATKVRPGMQFEGGMRNLVSRTIIKEVWSNRVGVLSSDAMDDERFLSGQSIMEQNIRSLMCAPFFWKGEFLGLIQIDSTSETQAFTEADLDLLQIVCVQASIAIANSRAYRKRQQFTQNLFHLGRVTQRISSYLNRERILKEAVKQSSRLLNCTKGSVIIRSGNQLRLFYALGIKQEVLSQIENESVGSRFARFVIQEGQSLLSSDMKDLPPELAFPPNPRYESNSFLIVPIFANVRSSGRSRPLGALCMTDKMGRARFTPNDQRILEIVASQTGIALSNADLYEKATVDQLTRVYVRRYFDQRLQDEVRRHRRQGKPLSLLMIDLDHFKQVNDTYGHQAGDTVLREMGKLLKQNLRDNCIVARYGGEEFAVILTETEAKSAQAIAERIRLRIKAKPFRHGQQEIAMTGSLGIAELAPKDTKEMLIKKADYALYHAKNGGRNRWVLYGAGNGSQMSMPRSKGPHGSGSHGHPGR